MKDVAERKAVLIAERNVQAVVRGGGLQLEVERTAETFAQRESPGFVDAAAKGRVDYQLHAAAFVEEALGDDVVCVGTARSTARPSTIYCAACSAPGRSMPHSPSSQLIAAAACGELRSSGEGLTPSVSEPTCSRTCATCCESSIVREGASPRQKGTLGGAPFASSTDKEPDCTRRIRQEEFPRRKISPLRLSTAKSSSTVPIMAPSGSATTVYIALSGIAPPLVIAARRLPRRPRRRWLT